MAGIDELYLIARRVLLDALTAIDIHREAIVLVGAQAIYLRVGEADLAVAPFTTDADLALDPFVLKEVPPLEQALRSAGFLPKSNDSVGIWITKQPSSTHGDVSVAVDLLVPASFSSATGRRSAGLPGHDSHVARKVGGLEGALIDVDVMKLEALEESDTRSFDVRVAGPAALLIAKVHKISERQGTSRQSDKDALDVLRLLRGIETEDMGVRYTKLLADERCSKSASEGRALLETLFARRTGVGVEMAIRSAGVLADPAEIALSCQALAGDLLDALSRAAVA